MKRLRQTKKYRAMLSLLRSGRIPKRAVDAARAADAHEEAYWQLLQLGWSYDPDAGWCEEYAAAPVASVGVRFEGPHAACVAAEAALRSAGIEVCKRSGPTRGRGGAYLTYLDIEVHPAQTAGARPRAAARRTTKK